MGHDIYINPLSTRYAGKEMNANWSEQKKHSTWRRLWLALAKSQKALGLQISDEQIAQMQAHLDDIDFEAAARKEAELRHDVMSHVHIFGELCPLARPIMHLGATSCYVTDNTELVQIRDALGIVRGKLLKVIANFASLSLEHKDLPVLGFTHYQPAQLTTLGKRFSLYLQDLLIDFQRLDAELANLPFRGVKGTTGTQASFMALFSGDSDKVKKLDRMVADEMGFGNLLQICGQTYTRKLDYYVLSVLSGIAQSAYKFAGDLRLMSNLKEVEEPFGKKQIGSSAMAYKRNPMRSERVCSISRFVISLTENAAHTHASQWFERTLDDSANRRLSLPQAFLGADAVLSLLADITAGIVVWPRMIARHISQELPFMATENILMEAVRQGGDRQELHEAIRVHSMAAARQVKEHASDNDLLDRIKNDPLFAGVAGRMDDIVNPPDFIGRAPDQVREFIEAQINPLLAENRGVLESAQMDQIRV